MSALATKTRAKRISVLVTGIGGDNVLDGHPRLFSELARQGHPARAAMHAVRLKGMEQVGARSRLWYFVVRPLLRGLVPVPSAVSARRRLRSHLDHYPWAGPRLRRYLRRVAEAPAAPTLRLDSPPEERFEQLARLPYIHQMCVGRVQDDALLGCSRRDPFMDEEFLRVVARVPPLDLMRGDFLRGLLRAAMSGVLPEGLRTRRTKAPIGPVFQQMADAAGGLASVPGLRALADVSHLADLGIAEPRAFRAAFDHLSRHPGEATWFHVWPALAAEAWLRLGDQGARAGAVLQ
jgi:asparagine synthase (glutamine-hydrolysing)